MYVPHIIATVAQTGADGLTFDEVVAELPTDPASLFTIFVLLASLALVFWYGRPRGGKGGRPA